MAALNYRIGNSWV